MKETNTLPPAYRELLEGFKEGKVKSGTINSFLEAASPLGFEDDVAFEILLRAMLFKDSPEANLFIVNRDGVDPSPSDKVHALAVISACLRRGWSVGDRIRDDEELIVLCDNFMRVMTTHLRAGGRLPAAVRNNLRGLIN